MFLLFVLCIYSLLEKIRKPCILRYKFQRRYKLLLKRKEREFSKDYKSGTDSGAESSAAKKILRNSLSILHSVVSKSWEERRRFSAKAARCAGRAGWRNITHVAPRDSWFVTRKKTAEKTEAGIATGGTKK